jgi:hypothetical protein
MPPIGRITQNGDLLTLAWRTLRARCGSEPVIGGSLPQASGADGAKEP